MHDEKKKRGENKPHLHRV